MAKTTGERVADWTNRQRADPDKAEAYRAKRADSQRRRRAEQRAQRERNDAPHAATPPRGAVVPVCGRAHFNHAATRPRGAVAELQAEVAELHAETALLRAQLKANGQRPSRSEIFADLAGEIQREHESRLKAEGERDTATRARVRVTKQLAASERQRETDNARYDDTNRKVREMLRQAVEDGGEWMRLFERERAKKGGDLLGMDEWERLGAFAQHELWQWAQAGLRFARGDNEAPAKNALRWVEGNRPR